MTPYTHTKGQHFEQASTHVTNISRLYSDVLYIQLLKHLLCEAEKVYLCIPSQPHSHNPDNFTQITRVQSYKLWGSFLNPLNFIWFCLITSMLHLSLPKKNSSVLLGELISEHRKSVTMLYSLIHFGPFPLPSINLSPLC